MGLLYLYLYFPTMPRQFIWRVVSVRLVTSCCRPVCASILYVKRFSQYITNYRQLSNMTEDRPVAFFPAGVWRLSCNLTKFVLFSYLVWRRLCFLFPSHPTNRNSNLSSCLVFHIFVVNPYIDVFRLYRVRLQGLFSSSDLKLTHEFKTHSRFFILNFDTAINQCFS